MIKSILLGAQKSKFIDLDLELEFFLHNMNV